jgi:hypothetical protein
MAILKLYENEFAYNKYGWFDGEFTIPGWVDHEWGDSNPILLATADAGIFLDDDTFFQPPPITVIVLPALFDDGDLIFNPVAIRKLDPPDMYLKNEVRRIR